MSRRNVQETIMSYLPFDETGTSPDDLNVVAGLHKFWEQKKMCQPSSSCAESDDLAVGEGGRAESLLLYQSAPSPGSSCVCYVTLPGGSCFGNYKTCNTQAEARRDAARVALMNSLINELPSRQITSQFISQSLQQAATDSTISIEDASNSGTSLGTYNLLLHSCIGKTMLQFQEMMTVFQLLHWNGTLKALRERQYSQHSVISYYSQRGLDEYMRSSMALDWLIREQRSPGRLGKELHLAQRELVLTRRRGMELRFYKEKSEILNLALSQAYIQPTLKVNQALVASTSSNNFLYRIHSQDTEGNITSNCSTSSTLDKNTNETVPQT